jgi:hypothetical protein
MLFTVALPALLLAWARSADRFLELPAVESPAAGWSIAAAGTALVLWAWVVLLRDGGGLPMNAFPPTRFVASGPYRYLAHPIYVGFSAALFGGAIATASPAGFWIVAPVTALACVALVLGHETKALRRRFGPDLPRPLISLPPDTAEPARRSDRAAAVALVAVPWLALYGVALLLGPAAGSMETWFGFERRLPVLEQAEILYCSAYPVAAGALFIPRTRGETRRLMVRALLAMAAVFPLYFFLPLVTPPRPFHAHGFWGRLLLEERAHDSMVAAFPSFHVVWTLLAAGAWGSRFPGAKAVAYTWAALVALSCLATGMHSMVDVAAGVLVFVAAVKARALWEWLRNAAERTANHWSEWRVGRLRILGYGWWAALACFVALSLVSAVMGPGKLGLIYSTAAFGLLGAFLWARLCERPARDMRPFGFYGGLFGIWAAAAASPLVGVAPSEAQRLLAAYCLATPFLQGIGRVRCLMQGCCHGAPANERLGIRYRLSLSRVAKAGLDGLPLHPTPLYSILWNGVVALALLRLWWCGAGPQPLCGTWLVLSGLGRFVEELYRGEPQTPIVAGLRLYQWVAVGTVVMGAILLAIPPGAPLPPPRLAAMDVAAALGAGAIAWFAYGMDFPDSRRPCARLA